MLTKKTLRKIVLATGVASMAVGLATTLSIETRASVATGGGEFGPSKVVDCGGVGTGDKTICEALTTVSCTFHDCS